MKKILLLILLMLCFHMKSYSQDVQSTKIKANAAASSAYSSTGVSMAIWGVIFAVGIAAAVVFIPYSAGSTTHS